jgi:hypothetical protein
VASISSSLRPGKRHDFCLRDIPHPPTLEVCRHIRRRHRIGIAQLYGDAQVGQRARAARGQIELPGNAIDLVWPGWSDVCYPKSVSFA